MPRRLLPRTVRRAFDLSLPHEYFGLVLEGAHLARAIGAPARFSRAAHARSRQAPSWLEFTQWQRDARNWGLDWVNSNQIDTHQIDTHQIDT
jgi:hypothetical protein